MLHFIRKILRGPNHNKHIAQDKEMVKAFRKKYANFRKLLDANAALADILNDIETKLNGNTLFGLVYIRNTIEQSLRLSRRMAVSLQLMSGGKYKRLTEQLNNIEENLNLLMQDTTNKEQCPYLTMPLSQVTYEHVDWVGGKSANLGELLNKAQVPVPRGFAISIAAYHAFMQHNGLNDVISKHLQNLNPDDRIALGEILDIIQHIVEEAELPPLLAEALDASWHQCFGEEEITVAVRSSAQVEDGEKSYAGQFTSELHVTRANLAASYRRVIASLFTPSATLYRLHQGTPLSASGMAVVCLEMVHATASGVAYSHDPVNLLHETIVINAVWGLGKYAVDGIVPPDLWVFTRGEKQTLVRRKAGNKTKMLTLSAAGTLEDAVVPTHLQKEFTLTNEEALVLAEYIARIEKSFGCYQDVEWAKDSHGNFIFLQSRPFDTKSGLTNAPKPPLLEQYPLLLKSEDIACYGVGHGPVVKPLTQEHLASFPQGGILVASHSSAEYAQVMDKVQGIITESGGVTGHMASICREFHVPCLLNAEHAMDILQEGTIVTLDAFSGYVYEGVATELLPLRLNLDSVRLQDTEVYSILRQVAALIVPLHLTDPNAASFTPSHCKTVHDVMRFVHELSYHEMFAISDHATSAGSVALKLQAPLPIDLYVIDLDSGTTAPPHAKAVKPEQLVCAPLAALLKGMLRPDTMFRKPRPVNMGGFLSVMGQQIATPQGGERFGDKSYAIISDRYMNFSSRVGYHYSVLDAYCGDTTSKNYIAFTFQGGAAGEVRRVRRCKAIALVLEALGFTVVQKQDMVKARFQKYPKEVIADRMDQLGRLLQVTRQMDMLMTNDAAIITFKENFMKGIYQ